MLKKIKVEQDKKIKKPLCFINLYAKNSGFISKYIDPKEVMKKLKPKVFEY